jgi:hypothetical protein|tara:strand:+ start:1067 stop:1234 length:168 start_codon:yes stop_codon:yes gene_type:complete
MIASDGARMENIINGETQCYERCSNMIKTIVPARNRKRLKNRIERINNLESMVLN